MLSRNSTSYPINLFNKIKKIHNDYKKIEDPVLLFHQYLIREFFMDPIFGVGIEENGRGLLIQHGVGTGKTILAASIMIALLDVRQTVILVAKSLQQNFLDNIDKIIDDKELSEKVKSRIIFVSINAFNSGTQMKEKSGTLNGKLLIVDEAHNLFKAIINSGGGFTNAKSIYNLIMEAVDLRILFLSGTPITKDPFELVCCINMLTGSETLPSCYETFVSQYIDVENNIIKNKSKLQNRLLGLISYIKYDIPRYPGENIENRKSDMPENLGIKVENIEMSKEQYIRYLSIRQKEESHINNQNKSIKSEKIRDTPCMSLPKPSVMPSYHIESRMISNFSIPLELLNKNTKDIDDKYFIKDNSPKIFRLIQNIKNGKKPCLVYSQFVKGGLDVISKYLLLNGYTEWTTENSKDRISHKPRFATISGKVSPKDRVEIVKYFNQDSNMYGHIIAVLLVSETGAEGLDLKNIREVHILEPYWDMTRIIQIQGRAIRKGSHLALPETEQNVKTIIYVSAPNKSYIEENKEEKTLKEKDSIDMKFLKNSIKKQKLIKQFENVMKSVCIECISNNYKDCKVCLPNNAKLFNPDNINTDINNKDPCIPYDIRRKVKVKEIIYNNEKYFYKPDTNSPLGYIIFIFDKKMNGYIEFPLNDKVTLGIVNEIIKSRN